MSTYYYDVETFIDDVKVFYCGDFDVAFSNCSDKVFFTSEPAFDYVCSEFELYYLKNWLQKYHPAVAKIVAKVPDYYLRTFLMYVIYDIKTIDANFEPLPAKQYPAMVFDGKNIFSIPIQYR